ncbi:MAG: hypothetical protein ACKVTZ_01885 [Bacteroidia bacterium]
MTRDIDIVIALKEEDVSNFVTSFEHGFYCDSEDIKNQVKRKGMFNLIDLTTITTIDFIVKKETEYRQIEFERRQKSDIYGFEFWLVSPEDLILSKLEWIQIYQSDRQLMDITNLLEIQTLDKAYILHWINQLNLNTFDLII